MCLAVPAEVVSIDGPSALVDVYGRRFVVSLMMMPDAVEPGDYVALQAQRWVVAKITRADAEAAKRFFEGAFPELAARAAAARAP